MILGLCMQVLAHLSLEEALVRVKALGLSHVELAVHPGAPWSDRDLGSAVADAGLNISALGIHQAGQLLLGPHGVETDGIHRGTPDEKVEFARNALIDAATKAQRWGVDTVCGFIGCAAWARWFPWPEADGWERMAPLVRERLLPILDAFGARGVRFAHECQPLQFAYDLHTAEALVDLVDGHEALAFNLDPANLALAEIDPCAFIAALGDRIAHVHAKDAERVAHNRGRSGAMAHGDWSRGDRGFRFRVPGWGDLDWRRVLSALQMAGYRGVLSIEHEDPTMSRREGVVQAIRHLQPLLLHDAPEARWW
jgi:sugar phosphate isomerase/epimerase